MITFQRTDTQAMLDDLLERGYVVGFRDPQRNIAFAGRYMVAEPNGPRHTLDASHGSYCVVGDDLEELIHDAWHWLAP